VDAAPLEEVPPRYPIRNTEVGLLSIEMKHTDQGAYSTDKSVFSIPVGVPLRDVMERLVRRAEYVQPFYQPRYRTYARIVRAEGDEPVGWDAFGDPLHSYTVITMLADEGDVHDLDNAFPGEPY
jgi:hypothetical protein